MGVAGLGLSALFSERTSSPILRSSSCVGAVAHSGASGAGCTTSEGVLPAPAQLLQAITGERPKMSEIVQALAKWK